MKQLILRAALVFCCAFSGCDSGPELPKTVPAEGVVTLDGVPVTGAKILFIGEGGIYNARGTTDAAGRFQVRSFEKKPGVVPGMYEVEISLAEATSGSEKKSESSNSSQNALPQQYASAKTSNLSADLRDQGDTNLKFELKSK